MLRRIRMLFGEMLKILHILLKNPYSFRNVTHVGLILIFSISYFIAK